MGDTSDINRLIVTTSPTKASSKKKDFLVIRVSPAILSSLQSNSGDFQSEPWVLVLQDITTASCLEDQMDAIRRISAHFNRTDNEFSEILDLNYVTLAVDLYLSAPLKHPAKYALTKTFNSIRKDVREVCVTCLMEGLKNRIKTGLNSQDLKDINIASSALLGCYDNFQLGPAAIDTIFLDILHFLDEVLVLCYTFLRSPNTPMLKVEVSKVTHTISRIIITALQKSEANIPEHSESRKSLLKNILEMATCILNSPEVPLDTRTNFGFVIVLILDYLQGPSGWMQLLGEDRMVPLNDEMSHLCLCSGLLSGLKHDQFKIVHSIEGKPIISCVLDAALAINERCVQESNLVLALWRVLQQLTRILTMHPKLVTYLEVSQVEDLLKHLWGLLDHYLDTVRHLGRAILDNILQLKDTFLSIGIDLVNRMSEAVLHTPETKRSRYVILSTMTLHISTSEIIKMIPNVINNLLTAMQYPSMSSHVSGAFVAMSTVGFKKIPYSEWCKIWVMPLFRVMEDCSACESPALEDALSKIMKLCPSIINEVLPDADMYRKVDLPKLKILLTCMKIGRKLGVIPSKNICDDSLWLGTLSITVLQSALCHESEEIRLSALALIVETHRSTEIIYQVDFMLLMLYLEYNINCEVPSFRQRSLAFITKVLIRMKDSAHTLSRPTNQRGSEKGDSIKILYDYKSFLLWILSFCFKCLRVGSNYSRRFCSLKVLTLIFDTLKNDPLFTSEDCQNQMWTQQNALTLLGVILVDSFEENKAMATKFLFSYPPSTLGLNSNLKLFKLFRSGCSLASSTHPSDCISAAYVLELCCCFYSKNLKAPLQADLNSNKEIYALEVFDAIQHLQAQLESESNVAQHNILLAASRGPMYGSLFCIRHLLQLIPDFSNLKENCSWRNLIKSLIDLCFKLDRIVSPVVNSSSPEGHLPMDFNQSSDLFGSNTTATIPPVRATAQMVLLCSWRTVKEVSLLLGKLSDCCPILPDKDGLLSEDQILSIGVHLITLLEETKHRGAFEQAYVGFSLLAARLWRHPKKSLQVLPRKWLNELMETIQNNEPSENKLCVTRRSAGVPYLVQALVSAELQTGASPQSLQWIMSQLLICAADKERHMECRTHALNILRALYRHAPLADHVAPYISEGVIVALSGFRGKTWAERNSATLLFSSLMTRIFGVRRSREELSSRNKMTGRVFFHRYPELYEFLLSEFERAVKALTSGDVAELAILHPILLLIARLYPSSLEGTDTMMQLNTFIPLVHQCARNSVLKTRLLAAKAIVPLITANVFVKYVDGLIQQIISISSENLTHGLALQIVYLLKNSSALNDDQSVELVGQLEGWMSKLSYHLNLPISNPVREVLLQIFEMVVGKWYSYVPSQMWKSLKEIILNIISQEGNKLKDQLLLGQSILEKRAARLLLQLLLLAQESDCEDVVSQLLRHANYEVVQETLVVFEKLMRKDDQGIIDEAEDIIPDVFGNDKHWLQRFPSNAVSAFRAILCQTDQLGHLVVSIVMTNKDINVQGRLALRALVHVSVSLWSANIDVKQLLSWCDSPHEGTSCAALACFSSLLKNLIDANEKIPPICEDGCKLLKLYCAEEIGVGSRMGAANFLLLHRQALERKYSFLSDETVCELWIVALMLICDDNSEVRLRAALLCQDELPVVPQKSLESLLDDFVAVMSCSPSLTLVTLLAVALGPLPDLSNFEADEERVFDKGETNMFIEHEMLTDLTSKHILPLVSSAANVTTSQWHWVWTTIGGTDNENVTNTRSLFDAIRKNAARFNFSDGGFLLPTVIVSSLCRLYKLELIFYGATKVNPNHCFPFNYNKMFG